MRGFVLKTIVVAAMLSTTLAIAQTTAQTQPATQASSTTQAQATPQTTPKPGASVQNANAPVARPDDDANRNPADISLERQINGLFAHRAEFQNVKISVNDGVVTLDGSVPTKIERRQAKAMVRSVNGVKKVQEHLSLSGGGVSGPGTVANTPMTAQNQPNAVGGNAGSSPQPANADAQSAEAASAPGGGTTGTILSAAPPSSNVGSSGGAIPQPTSSPANRPTTPRQAGTFGLTTIDTAGLASKINTALKNDPTLSNNNVMVNVSDQGVEVTGSVDTGKEKLTAMRIAQSYAGNFKVVDRLTLAGRAPAPNGQQNASQSPQTNGAGTPPPNVAGNTVLPTGTAQNTPVRDPKTAGDKSSNPRQ
jgi:osmotically-inducible protein OsmY